MMKAFKSAVYILTASVLLFGCVSSKPLATNPVPGEPAYEKALALGRGINLGNALDAPVEGEWGVTLVEEYFALIKKAGFDSVRIPMRWSAHAENEPPYTIQTDFRDRARWAVDTAIKHDLLVVLNVHHFLEIMSEPEKQLDKLVALWDQIGKTFADYPDTLYFEVLNEPNGNLTAPIWNEYLALAIKTIRATNPKRTIIAGPDDSNKIRKLSEFVLPEDDRNIIVTIHYYDPHIFTHQGASWTRNEAARNARDVQWNGTGAELAALKADFDAASAWAEKHKRPIYLGEFGAFEKADIDSRARWTDAVARHAEDRGFSWAYWEFCSTFGAYNYYLRKWKPRLLKALIPETK